MRGRSVWALHKVEWVMGVEITHGVALAGAARTPEVPPCNSHRAPGGSLGLREETQSYFCGQLSRGGGVLAPAPLGSGEIR